MLIGDKPLSLPAYTGALPALLTLACCCRRRYMVLTGVADAGAKLVRQEAETRGAVFVNAKETPFMNCGDCGQALDFTIVDAVQIGDVVANLSEREFHYDSSVC